MTAEVLALALLQTLAALLVGRALIALAGPPLGLDERSPGAPERWLLAASGFVTFAVIAMVGHMATSGWLLSQRWPLLVLAAAIVLRAAWKNRAKARLPRISVWVVVLGIALVLLYALPGIRGGSSLRTGDTPWHLGWTEQLLGGEPRPEGPAPAEFARNAYPWGHHAVLATLTRLVPGSDPLVAHEALQLLLLIWLPLSAACLARAINRRAGLAAAAAFSLIGGFGWVMSGGPAFAESPREAIYGADLVVASPNALYALFPPAIPRELGLVLLSCAVLLVLSSLEERSMKRAALAGLSIGVVGLISVPMLISALAWAAVVAVVARRGSSWHRLVLAGVVALGTFALWFVPVLIDHLRHGGFVNISPRLGVEWPVPTSLASWGLLLPLALGGLGVVFTQPPLLRRGLIAFTAAAGGLLFLAWLRGRFGWELMANETVLHQGRYWPPAHLLASALAGLGITAAYAWLNQRSRVVATASVAGILAVGAISPVFASLDLTETIHDGKEGFLYGNPDMQRGSFLRSAASVMDPDDVFMVEGDDVLAFYLWQFSGARTGNAGEDLDGDNPWRIRYRGLAEAWHDHVTFGLLDPDWIITRDLDGYEPVVEPGVFRGQVWGLVRARDQGVTVWMNAR